MTTTLGHHPSWSTTPGGAATPAVAHARATTSISGGNRTRSHRDHRMRVDKSPVDGGQEPPPPPRRCLANGRSAIEGWGRSGCLSHHGELVEENLVLHVMEGGKGHGPIYESLQVAVAVAEATQKVHHQGRPSRRGRGGSPPCPSSGGITPPW
jgi:hypothetical protein